MHQSGIEPNQGIKDEFYALDKAGDTLYMQISIENDDFVKVGEGKKSGDAATDFQTMAAALPAKSPSYVLHKGDGAKWTVIFYMPESCPVRSKMVYASSTGALKTGLGGAFFTEDFPISEGDECTPDEFARFFSGDAKTAAMTYDEANEKQEQLGHAMAMNDKVSAIVGVPIKIADAAMEAIKAVKDGSKTTVELILDAETEVLGCAPACDAKVDDWVFPSKEPRYFVHNLQHTNPETNEAASKIIFVYFCPGNAPPKLKMFYSTCKGHIVKLFNTLEMTNTLNFECDCREECSEELLMAELYKPAEEIKIFKKPAARGRARKAGGTKFQG